MKGFVLVNDKMLDNAIKQKIIDLICVLIPTAKIYLYGSRARGTNRPNSDIDIALDAEKIIEWSKLDEVRTVLEATNIPYKIDVVDLKSASQSFANVILNEGILWHQPKD